MIDALFMMMGLSIVVVIFLIGILCFIIAIQEKKIPVYSPFDCGVYSRSFLDCHMSLKFFKSSQCCRFKE